MQRIMSAQSQHAHAQVVSSASISSSATSSCDSFSKDRRQLLRVAAFLSSTSIQFELTKQRQRAEARRRRRQQQGQHSVSLKLIQSYRSFHEEELMKSTTFGARSCGSICTIHHAEPRRDDLGKNSTTISISSSSSRRRTRSAISLTKLQNITMAKNTSSCLNGMRARRRMWRWRRSSNSNSAMTSSLVLLFLSVCFCCSFAESSLPMTAAAATAAAVPPPPPPPPPRRKSTHNDRTEQVENNQANDDDDASNRRIDNDNNGDDSDDNLALLQLLETEFWDGAQWRHGGWTNDITGHACSSPLDQVAPTGFEFVGGWKIVTQSSAATSSSSSRTIIAERDEYGWQYEDHNKVPLVEGAPFRKRTWLRTMMGVPSTTTKVVAVKKKKKKAKGKRTKISTTLGTTSAVSRPRRPSRSSAVGRWVRSTTTAIVEDFNFKGFGWAFYQSLFSPTFTVTLRCPLTSNFDCFDRNPALPSFASSASIYGSCASDVTVAVFLSCSMRIESCHWAATRFVESIRWILVGILHTLMSIVSTLLRGLLYVYSALVFPFTRTWPEQEWPRKDESLLQSSASSSGPMYSRDVEERIGFSLSWRYAIAQRRYEFRVSYWHWYAPTLYFLWQTWSVWIHQLLSVITRESWAGDASVIPTDDDDDQIKKRRLDRLQQRRQPPAWFARRSASVGLSTSAPIPVDPYIGASLALSLSGFYFTPILAKGSSTTEDTSTASKSLTSASKIKEDKGAIAAILAASERPSKKEEEVVDDDELDAFIVQNNTATTRINSKSAASTIFNEEHIHDRTEHEVDEEEDAILSTASDELVTKAAKPRLENEKMKEEV